MLNFIKKIIGSFLPQERKLLIAALGLLSVAVITRTAIAIQENSVFVPVAGGTYSEGVVGQPIFVNPIISSNQPDQDISTLIYSRLSQLMANYELQDEGRTYIISLKQNLLWNDGQPLTSDDIIFTLRLIQDPETRSPLFMSWQGVTAERLSEIKIRFSLPAPYAFFLEHIARLPIIPEHIFKPVPIPNIKLSEYNLKPIGNGPYRFDSLSKRNDGFISQYRLTLNELFQGEKPFIENIVFKFFEDDNALLEAFQLRKIDGFGSLKPLVLDGFVSKNASVKAVKMPRYYAVFFNPNINPLLKDQKFRYALTEAIDKEKLVRDIFENNVDVTDSPFAQPRQEEYFLSYNPEAAQEKLKDIERNNLELNLILPSTDFLRKTAAFIQEAWQSIGIPKVNVIELKPEEILNEIIRPRNYEILLFGQILENRQDLFPFWHSSQRFHPGLNLALYENRNVDDLTEEIRQELNGNIRNSKLPIAEEIIIEEAPAIFLYTMPYLYVHNENLRGFQKDLIVNPADRFDNVADWYILSVRIIK